MPPRPSNVIRVPKPPRSAFDKDRPASRLLLDQMIHVSAALIERLKNLDNRESSAPVTEAQAAELVRVATNILHPHTAEPDRAKRSKPRRGKKKGRARA
jgi:hypothetical protein